MSPAVGFEVMKISKGNRPVELWEIRGRPPIPEHGGEMGGKEAVPLWTVSGCCKPGED